MSEPISFGIIGAGWRSEFFCRLAAMAPDRLRVSGVLVRRPEVAERMSASWGVPVVPSIGELLATGPEFVIAAVSWPSMPQVVAELVEDGVKVFAETPPAPDAEGLRALWEKVGDRGLVQVGEQYMLMPGHAARKKIVDSGAIGVPSLIEVASTHLYHATSMMRAFLGAGFGPVSVNARAFEAPLADPLGFAGWNEDPSPRPTRTTIATLDFGDGRAGLYQFVDNQWWNPLWSRRILVRSGLGEIRDDEVVRLSEEGVIASPLSYRRLGRDLDLEGNELDSISFEGRIVYRNAWRGARFSEDDLAVADLLAATGAWARDEAEGPYSLADACQDHLLGLAIEEAVRTGAEIRTRVEPWAPRP